MKDHDPRTAEFESHRGLLTGVAYRMLGSVADAEDMVQEAWLRWRGAEGQGIRSAKSWLLTVVSRLCLDRLKSARAQREEYYGTWLPEPLVQPASPAAEVDESVSIALLLVLEKLSPVERAGFLLHDVFGFSFDEIANVLEKPAVNCRKLVSRARERVQAEKPRFTSTPREHEELLQRFLRACRAGEMEGLTALLTESASLYSDGGGKASAVPRILTGAEAVATFFLKIVRAALDQYETRPTSFNGVPGLLILQDGQPATAIAFEVHEGKIARIFAHRNPDKLRAFAEQAPPQGAATPSSRV